MKRLISLFVVITMLAGLCITAGATTSGHTYATYNVSTTLGSAAGVLASNPNGRYGKDVYTMAKNGDLIMAVDQASIKDVRFNEGDKVHITTEMMLPAGKVTTGKYSDWKVGVLLDPLFGTKEEDGTYNVSTSVSENNVDGIRVANRGKKDYNIAGNAHIIGFDTAYQCFSVFGNVNTAQKWEYDKWYRFDVVLTMGANPTASVYVNGEPLTVAPEINAEGVARHDDNTDATFDGVHTSSENVSIGTWAGDTGYGKGEFVKKGLWGLNNAWLIRTYYTEESTLYWGDMIYRELPAGTSPELPEAFTLLGVKDGGTFAAADLSAVKVQVPSFIAHKTASVVLEVDGTAIAEKEAGTGIYDLSAIGAGNKAIALTAKDAQGSTLRTASMRITIPGESDIHGAGMETFGTAAEAATEETPNAFWWVDNKEGFYGGSAPRNKGDHAEGYRMITAAGGPDGADDYYAKIERDTIINTNAVNNQSRLSYRVNHGWGSQPEESRKTWNDGIVRVNYDLYLPNYTDEGVTWSPAGSEGEWTKRFMIGLGKWESETLVMWGSNTHPATFGFEGSTSDVPNYNSIKMGGWTHHEWVLDYTNHTMQLWQDGVAVTNTDSESPYYGTPDLEMNEGHKVYDGFEGVWFKWNGIKGNIGVDNMEIEYELAIPYVKSADFGEGNAQGGEVLTTAAAVAVEVPGMVYTADGTGTMADYVSLVDGEGTAVEGASAVMADDGKTVNVTIPEGALVAGEDYQIKLAAGVPYGREGHTISPKGVDGADPQEYSCTVKSTAAASVYSFTAVDSFEDEVDDGVADAITVSDVRFTTHAHMVNEASLAGYAGGDLTAGYKLRADMLVSNRSDSAKTFAIVVATYSGDRLVDVAIGGSCTVPAKAENIIITSAPIVLGEETGLTAKAFLVNDMGTLAPLSYSYDILGNVAQ